MFGIVGLGESLELSDARCVCWIDNRKLGYVGVSILPGLQFVIA